ncbi:MAG: helix-turn-helix domain-containing protein [Pseudomonadota bacterium]
MSEQRMSSNHRKLNILRAVRHLFCKKGLNVTTRELSEAAGVSEALIFKHFTNKEGVYKALLENSCQAHESVGNDLIELEPSTEVLVFANYLMIYIVCQGFNTPDDEFVLGPEECMGLILQSLQTDGEVARQLFDQGLGPWVPHYVRSMEAAIASGEMIPNSAPLESLVWMSHHALLGMKMTRHSHPNAFMAKEMNSDQFMDHSLAFLSQGMGVRHDVMTRIVRSNEFKYFKEKLKKESKK